jgi:hypothetical protein
LLAASSRSSVSSRIAASASIGSPNAKPCAHSRDRLARNGVDDCGVLDTTALSSPLFHHRRAAQRFRTKYRLV